MSCQSNPPVPKWDAAEHGGIWVGSSKDGGLVRRQAGQVCRGNEPCMDDKYAFTEEGFRSFYTTFVLGCDKWKPSVPTEALNEALRKLSLETGHGL